MDQIWAEAYMYYKIGEPLYLVGEAQRLAQEQQEEHREVSPWEGIILEFWERKVPRDWNQRNLQERREFWAFAQKDNGDDLVERDRICVAEVWCECFNKELRDLKMQDAKTINSIISKIEGLEKATSMRIGGYGIQRGFKKK